MWFNVSNNQFTVSFSVTELKGIKRFYTNLVSAFFNFSPVNLNDAKMPSNVSVGNLNHESQTFPKPTNHRKRFGARRVT
jgi:hypothetical protein